MHNMGHTNVVNRLMMSGAIIFFSLPVISRVASHFQLRGGMQEKSFMLGVQDVGKIKMLIFLVRNYEYCVMLTFWRRFDLK